MTRTILSLWLPHLPTDRLTRRGAVPAGVPEDGLATVDRVRNAQRLVALDAAALAAGLKPGMALADARAVRPGLAVQPADPRADAALLDEVAAWCSRFTPLVAPDGADGLLLRAIAEMADRDTDVASSVREGVQQLRTAYRTCLQEAQEAGELRDDADADALARYFVAVTQGMEVQGRAGASRADLTVVALTSLTALPLADRD